MSWDAVILKINGPFRPIGEVADEDYLPLGGLESVAERIRTSFPGAEWSGPTWANWGLDADTGVTIDLGSVESDNMIMVSVSGSGNPVPHLLALAGANDWVVLDCSTSELLNPDEGSSEGWEGYQSLLKGLRERERTTEEPPPLVTPPTAPLAPSEPPPQSASLTPPRTRKKKKAAKKAGRKILRKGAAKKLRPGKKRPKTTKKPNVKKRAKPKKRPKAKSSAKKKKPKKKK